MFGYIEVPDDTATVLHEPGETCDDSQLARDRGFCPNPYAKESRFSLLAPQCDSERKIAGVLDPLSVDVYV